MKWAIVAGGFIAAAVLRGALADDVITAADVMPWREDFADAAAWKARPDWQPNPDAAAAVAVDGRAFRFEVTSPGTGMKWARAIPPISAAEAPYLWVRYRAEGAQTSSSDYFVFVDDHNSGTQCKPIRLCDIVADGEWHSVAVDVRRAGAGPIIDGLAIQVQGGSAAPARVWIEDIAFLEAPPPDAALLGEATVAAKPDSALELAGRAWEPKPAWLGNPAPRCSAAREGAAPVVFRVDDAGRGMKWFRDPGSEIDLTGHRYLAVRYKAVNLRSYTDYAIALLGKAADGSAYEEVIRGSDLRADGQWHIATAPLANAQARLSAVNGIAVQVQADAAPADLCLDTVTLTSTIPATRFADALPFEPAATFDGFAPVDLEGIAWQSAPPVLDILHMTGYPSVSEITVSGVPFRLQQGDEALAATGFAEKGEFGIPVEGQASQIFILMLAVMRGQEEPVFGGGPLRAIGDTDRFRLRLNYEDGSSEECFPVNVLSRHYQVVSGAQMLCAWADPAKPLQTLTLWDGSGSAAFAIAGVTCRTEGSPLFSDLNETAPPVHVKRWESSPVVTGGSIRIAGDSAQVTIENSLLRAVLDMGSSPVLSELYDKVSGRPLLTPGQVLPIVAAATENGPLEQGQLRLVANSPQDAADGAALFEATYEVLPCPGLQLVLRANPAPTGELCFGGELVNNGDGPWHFGVTLPQIGPYVLGGNLEDSEYVFPCRGAIIGRGNTSLSERYSGLFGLQFMATVSAAAGEGLYLRTEDTTCIERNYLLDKDARGLTMAVSYPVRPLAPGQVRKFVNTFIGVSDGDWHAALDAYRRWLDTWYTPAAPRKPWFREVFNFRQRFLHWLDPLYDASTGTIDLPRAIAEARDSFGGADYLHLFDWGNCGPYGRIYGRVGDYSPYDYLTGGLANLHDTIAGVRDAGVPVGLYIEGYLLDERGKLGQAHGPAWQLHTPDGKGARWPSSSELFICPGIKEWREIQAATYAEKVRELGVDGMYIDEFGFTGHDKDCHGATHGHPVPSYPVTTELETTRAIRQAIDAVKPGVAIYTEESPCDVTSQYQDGSFTYALNQSLARGAHVPVNLFRFAVPDFKTFEILICDKPTGAWAAGVRWTFFNGEGIWLEGPANEWFAPETLATIRKCHAILRGYRRAFTCAHPTPLTPTLAGGVWANQFPGEQEEVWTLYNARHRTVSGPMLRVPRKPGWIWRDLWNECTPDVTEDGGSEIVSTRIAPQGVGCLVRKCEGWK